MGEFDSGDYRRNSSKNDQSIKDIETNNIIEEKSPVRNAWDDAADGIVSTFETAKRCGKLFKEDQAVVMKSSPQ